MNWITTCYDLPSVHHQAITRIITDWSLFSTEPPRKNFAEIQITTQIISFRICIWKYGLQKCLKFHPGLNVFGWSTQYSTVYEKHSQKTVDIHWIYIEFATWLAYRMLDDIIQFIHSLKPQQNGVNFADDFMYAFFKIKLLYSDWSSFVNV